ncbi:MAG: hypothetical protein ABIR16_00460, partial [Dokdonella sp.]
EGRLAVLVTRRNAALRAGNSLNEWVMSERPSGRRARIDQSARLYCARHITRSAFLTSCHLRLVDQSILGAEFPHTIGGDRRFLR